MNFAALHVLALAISLSYPHHIHCGGGDEELMAEQGTPPGLFGPAPAYSTENGIFGGKNFWSSDGCYLGSTYIDEDGHHVYYDGTKIVRDHRNASGGNE